MNYKRNVYRQVNKPTARKMYNRGYGISVLPCKISLRRLSGTYDYDWIQLIEIPKQIEGQYEVSKFDRSVREFEYYNCNAELGYYAHYYVLEEDYNKYMEELKYANQSY